MLQKYVYFEKPKRSFYIVSKGKKEFRGEKSKKTLVVTFLIKYVYMCIHVDKPNSCDRRFGKVPVLVDQSDCSLPIVVFTLVTVVC